MTIDWMLVATIAAPIIALFVGVALNRTFERRPKLITYYGHVSEFKLQDEHKTPVFTHSVVVRNAGGRAASNVRLGHNVLPNFQVIPSVNFQREDLPSGGSEILIHTLVPGEQITVSYLYFPPLTWSQINTYVKSDQGLAKVLNVLPTVQLPKWQLFVLRLLVLIGLIASVYLIINLFTWAYTLIPKNV